LLRFLESIRKIEIVKRETGHRSSAIGLDPLDCPSILV